MNGITRSNQLIVSQIILLIITLISVVVLKSDDDDNYNKNGFIIDDNDNYNNFECDDIFMRPANQHFVTIRRNKRVNKIHLNPLQIERKIDLAL